jgi:5-(carboxyamino)imidazole ribonucleotide mutase/phosphoribosylaminoimidazole-succinocarboxamide synthase
MHVASAHKAPAFLLQILSAYEADPRPKVYVTIAGRSNALSALVDTQVSAPVLACPPLSDTFGGADIFSSLRMPGGVAPAVVLDPAGAALVAAKILGLSDPTIREQIVQQHRDMVEKVLQEDKSLQKEEPRA